MVKVEQLNVYPIKALGGVSVQSREIGPLGLDLDRRWMLVDKDGKFLTQRYNSRLALFKCTLTTDELVIRYENDEFRIGLNPMSPALFEQEVEIWSHRMIAGLESTEVSQWFSEHLGDHVNLVRYIDSSERVKEKEYGSIHMQFPDGYPILIANENSLADLNQRLPKALPMNRFRPNIVISGLGAWKEMELPNLRSAKGNIKAAKMCERCVVTTIDQSTAEKDPKEPLKSLVELHGSPARFGLNAYVSEDSTFIISVGDTFELELTGSL